MARIKIADLPVLEDLSENQMKGIFGGELGTLNLQLTSTDRGTELSIGYSGHLFDGEIQCIEPTFGSEDMSLGVSGYDFEHRLTRGQAHNSTNQGDTTGGRFGPTATP